MSHACCSRCGTSAFELIYPDDVEYARRLFAQSLQQPQISIYGQLRVRCEDEPSRWLEVIFTNLLTEPGVAAVVTNFRDVTERVRAERHLAAQYAVARSLAGAATLAEAAPHVLQVICEGLEWDRAELWSPIWDGDRQGKVLRCVEARQMLPNAFPEFDSATRHMGFALGVGLPGRVWATGQMAWIADVTRDANFPRASLAAKDGLRTGFAFPIRMGSEVGVLTFFRRQIQPPDESQFRMLENISHQIAQFLEARQAEQALRESEELYRLITDSSTDLIGVMDLQGTIVFLSPSARQIMGHDPAELIGTNAFRFVHPEDAPASQEAWARAA